MFQRYSRVDFIIGRIGVSCGGGIVCICGQMSSFWSCLTGVTVGFVLFWIVSWLLCILVGVRREVRIVQRIGGSFWRSYSGYGVRLSKAQLVIQFCFTLVFRDWWWVIGYWRVRRRESFIFIIRTDSKFVMYVQQLQVGV